MASNVDGHFQGGDAGARRIIIIRNGETIETLFGPGWLQYYEYENSTFTSKWSDPSIAAKYLTYEETHLPRTLLKRSGGHNAYYMDSPLTKLGKIGSLQVGIALGVKGIKPPQINGVVYCSPASACIETAHLICTGLANQTSQNFPDPAIVSGNDGLQLRIENGLLPQLGDESRFDVKELPEWWKPAEIVGHFGRKVDENYNSFFVPVDHETVKQFYGRMDNTIDHLLTKTKPGGTLIIVGHNDTIEGCARQAYNISSHKQCFFNNTVNHFGDLYVATMVIRGSEREVIEPILPPYTRSNYDEYAYEYFFDEEEMKIVMKE